MPKPGIELTLKCIQGHIFFSVNNNYFKNNKNQSSLNSYMDGVNKFF